jgi:hypothetical protein
VAEVVQCIKLVAHLNGRGVGEGDAGDLAIVDFGPGPLRRVEEQGGLVRTSIPYLPGDDRLSRIGCLTDIEDVDCLPVVRPRAVGGSDAVYFDGLVAGRFRRLYAVAQAEIERALAAFAGNEDDECGQRENRTERTE